MSASQVVSSFSTQPELFNFNQPLSPESVGGHSSDSENPTESDERLPSQSDSHHSPTSTASHHSQVQHNGAYPTTEQQQQQQGQAVTRAAHTNNTLPERPLVPTCPADWEAKKDIIYDLYMNKNFILNDVVEIMLTTHRFKATARMYKGQFAKWRWAKYNKSGNTNATKPTKSRSVRRKGITSGSGGHTSNGHVVKAGYQGNYITQPAQMIRLYFQHEPTYIVESTLLAYASYIARWADPERETPWRTNGPVTQVHITSNELPADESATITSNSILQNVALAIRHLQCNTPEGATKGGALLRHAFLQIEAAITTSDDDDIQAIWDCCLAIPQLLVLHNSSSSLNTPKQNCLQPTHDILPIFTRFLHHLTTLKYAQAGCTSHPLHQIASSLHHLAANNDFASLHLYITRAWKLWINTVRQLRGETDHVTIHLKRGYVILMDPEHAIVKNLVSDFGGLVRRELERRGEAKTTERILELEELLGRMYLPLFDAGVVVPTSTGGGMGIGAGQRARMMLGGLVGRLEGKYGVGNWGGGFGDGGLGGMGRGGGVGGNGNGHGTGVNGSGRGNGMTAGDNATTGPRPPDIAPTPPPGPGSTSAPTSAPTPGQVPEQPHGPPVPMHHWDFLDRYLFFSAHHFMASIADYEGDAATALALRRKILVMNGGGLPGSLLFNNNHQLPLGMSVGLGMGTAMSMAMSMGMDMSMGVGTGFGVGAGFGAGLGIGAGLGLGMGSGPGFGTSLGVGLGPGMGPAELALGMTAKGGKDRFWLQTARLIQQYVKGMGKWEEAEEIGRLVREREVEVEREQKLKRVLLPLEMGRDMEGELEIGVGVGRQMEREVGSGMGDGMEGELGMGRQAGREMGMQVMPMSLPMSVPMATSTLMPTARSGSLTAGSATGLVGAPGLHMGGGMVGSLGRSMSLPTVPFGVGLRSAYGSLGTFTPRSYSSLQTLNEFDTLDTTSFGAARLGQLRLPSVPIPSMSTPPMPMPRSIPISIPPTIPTGWAGFVVDERLPGEEFDNFQQFERAALDLGINNPSGSQPSSGSTSTDGNDNEKERDTFLATTINPKVRIEDVDD
ncbi:hypothetical protein B0T20DRAFT_502094 [Sordaria brevicollis]|uniref:Clr5 domain-containing protein n=1 Tax=Sordaria brevicollis TaxID=83679 RepID=A0AAE0PAY1_SORBR|nr:hypothetical protein B0T20DRAFT_502094 [Sordaria brevicollis]